MAANHQASLSRFTAVAAASCLTCGLRTDNTIT